MTLGGDEGKLSGHVYRRRKVDSEICKHDRYEADESCAERVCSESTRMGALVMTIFTGYECYWKTTDSSKRCDFPFWVRTNSGKFWKNGEIMEKRTSDWKPIIDRKAKTTTVFVPAFRSVTERRTIGFLFVILSLIATESTLPLPFFIRFLTTILSRFLR